MIKFGLLENEWGKDTLFICIIETRKHSNDSNKLKKHLDEITIFMALRNKFLEQCL